MLPRAACQPGHGLPQAAKHISLYLQSWAAHRSKYCKSPSPTFSPLQLILGQGHREATGTHQCSERSPCPKTGSSFWSSPSAGYGEGEMFPRLLS